MYMFYTLKLAFKNIFSRKSSFVIIAFITFAITMLIVINSVFDGTDNGIRTVFMDSFTGDLVIREKTKDNVSLFGNVSLVDESIYPIDELSFYEDIEKYLNEQSEVKSFIPQVSTFSLLEVENKKFKSAIFGINVEEYFNIMPSLQLIEGTINDNDEKCILVSETWVQNFKKQYKKDIKLGDEVQLIFSDGNTFRIRSVKISGIYKYPIQNDILDKIVLADSSTVRSLLGMNEIFSSEVNIATEDTNLIDSIDMNFDDFDSLFAEESDVLLEESTFDNFEDILSDSPELVVTDVTNWHFIVVRLHDDVNENSVIRKINHWAKQNGYPIEAVNWRVAAGPTAQYVYWLRIVLLIGVFIILFAGLIVVTNTLVINVLDRTKEIGTMRALGANKRNIVFLCMSETIILSVISALISILISFFIIMFIQKFPITLKNLFLEQLFGSNQLIPELTLSNIGFGFLVSLIIGLTSWIMPVIEALKILPIKAMKGGN